jgi:hypothetical protein
MVSFSKTMHAVGSGERWRGSIARKTKIVLREQIFVGIGSVHAVVVSVNREQFYE